MIDPIADLVRAVERDGQASFEWVIAWSGEGRDPIAVAWERSRSPLHMVRLLELAAHPAREAARKLLAAPILWESTDADRARTDALRRLVAQPPTLQELTAARSGTLAFLAPRAPIGLIALSA